MVRPGIFGAAMPCGSPADPGLIVPGSAPLHNYLTVRKLGARPRIPEMGSLLDIEV